MPRFGPGPGRAFDHKTVSQMDGVPRTTHSWLKTPQSQGSLASDHFVSKNGNARIYSSLNIQSPLVPEKLNWQVTRANRGFEKEVDATIAIPDGPNPRGSGISIHATEVLDSSFSDDSIDELIVGETLPISTNTSRKKVSVLKNSSKAGNDRKLNVSDASTSGANNTRGVSQSEAKVGEILGGSSARSNRPASKMDANKWALHVRNEVCSLQPLIVSEEDTSSIDSASGTSTPVKVWDEHRQSDYHLKSPNSPLQGRRLVEVRRAHTSQQVASSPIPSVERVPQLSGSSIGKHLASEGKRQLSALPSHFDSSAIKRASLPDQVEPSFRMHERPDHRPFSRRGADLSSQNHAGEPVFPGSFGAPDASGGAISWALPAPRTGADRQDASESPGVRVHFVDLVGSSDGVGASDPLCEDDAQLLGASANADASEGQLAELRLQLELCESRRIAERRAIHDHAKLALDIIGQVRQAQEEVAILQGEWYESPWHGRLEPEGRDHPEGRTAYAARPASQTRIDLEKTLSGGQQISRAPGSSEAVQNATSDMDKASSRSGAAIVEPPGRPRSSQGGDFGSSGLAQVQQARRGSVASETHAFNLKALTLSSRREASRDEQQMLSERAAIQRALQQALNAKRAVEEQLQVVAEQSTQELEDFRAGQATVVTELAGMIGGLEEVQQTYAEFEQILSKMEKEHSYAVSDLENQLDLMKEHHDAVESEWRQSYESLRKAKERDESAIRQEFERMKQSYMQSILDLEQSFLSRDSRLIQQDFEQKQGVSKMRDEISSLKAELGNEKLKSADLMVQVMNASIEFSVLADDALQEASSLLNMIISKYRSYLSKKTEINRQKLLSEGWEQWNFFIRNVRTNRFIYRKFEAKRDSSRRTLSFKLWKGTTNRNCSNRRLCLKIAERRSSRILTMGWLNWLSEVSERGRKQTSCHDSCADIVQRMRERQCSSTASYQDLRRPVTIKAETETLHVSSESPHSSGGANPSTDSDFDSTRFGRDHYARKDLGYIPKSQIFSSSDLQSMLSKYSEYSSSDPKYLSPSMRDVPVTGTVNLNDSRQTPSMMKLHDFAFLETREQDSAEGASMLQGISRRWPPDDDSHAISMAVPEKTRPYRSLRFGTLGNANRIFPSGKQVQFRSNSYFPLEVAPMFPKATTERENVLPSWKYWSAIKKKTSFVPESSHSTEPRTVYKSALSSLSPKGRAILSSHGMSAGHVYDMSPSFLATSHYLRQRSISADRMQFSSDFNF